MSPAYVIAAGIASISGLGLGVVGLFEGMPALAGGGFAVTAALQLWTMGKLEPIRVRLAVLEERISRLEEDISGRRRMHNHNTPPIED